MYKIIFLIPFVILLSCNDFEYGCLPLDEGGFVSCSYRTMGIGSISFDNDNNNKEVYYVGECLNYSVTNSNYIVLKDKVRNIQINNCYNVMIFNELDLYNEIPLNIEGLENTFIEWDGDSWNYSDI